MERIVLARAFFLLFVLSTAVPNSADRMVMQKSVDASSFDASDVTWAHAINSRDLLEEELAGPVDFIEADVSLGHLYGSEFDVLMPVMAHPPSTTSDLSLSMFFDLVTERATGKGVKLDFKSLEVVEPSLILLQQYSGKLNFTLWLNADILYGPIDSPTAPVKDDLFMLLCHQYFPDAVLSVGWTTEWYPTYTSEWWYYDWKYVRKMADIIRCFGYEKKYPTFTFPVRGIFASRSIRQLQWLLGVVPDSSLTIWSAKNDPLELKDLMQIRISFPSSKVYYDVPDPIGSVFLKFKNSTTFSEKPIFFKNDQWMTLTHGQDPKCTSYTYISNNTIVFGQSLSTAVLLKKLITVDAKHGFKAEGRMRFFDDYEQQTLSKDRYLTIVVVDVSLFTKNSSDSSLDLTGSDTDVLWTAMNASQLHTFRHNTSDQCRIFKLDTDEERSFQAWTVPCDEMRDQDSIEEIARTGVMEVSSRNRLVLPKGPFMMGFMSSGDGHVVIHDLEISNKVAKTPTNGSSVTRITMGFLSILFMYFAMRRLLV